jgi:catechol 2,3-dioxygenase-like lactoylglutathione lyase family enzyme
MDAKALTPILNVSDFRASVAWFARLGWRECWAWGEPPGFGAVGSGACEIFLCENGQGGRGRGPNTRTFGAPEDERADRGAWITMWVEDVDAVHLECLAHGVEVTFPPTDMPWNVREMHVRHPDGHVFRVSKGFPEE